MKLADSRARPFRKAEVEVRSVFSRGQRHVTVGPCPFCGGEHTHLWLTSDRVPGRRVAPCTASDPGECTLRAPAALLDREAGRSRRSGGRR